MISEVLNALFITYVATEYHLTTAESYKSQQSHVSLLVRPRVLGGTALLLIINVLDRLSGAANVVNNILQGFLHVPKIAIVILAYTGGLYLDCRRLQSRLEARHFGKTLSVAFCQVLPLYPLLAVVISFGFLILINLFEFLRLPLELLNMPIYYGTLYGPFSLVYLKVKRRILEERTSLPISSSAR